MNCHTTIYNMNSTRILKKPPSPNRKSPRQTKTSMLRVNKSPERTTTANFAPETKLFRNSTSTLQRYKLYETRKKEEPHERKRFSKEVDLYNYESLKNREKRNQFKELAEKHFHKEQEHLSPELHHSKLKETKVITRTSQTNGMTQKPQYPKNETTQRTPNPQHGTKKTSLKSHPENAHIKAGSSPNIAPREEKVALPPTRPPRAHTRCNSQPTIKKTSSPTKSGPPPVDMDTFEQCEAHILAISARTDWQQTINDELKRQAKFDNVLCQKLLAKSRRLMRRAETLEDKGATPWVTAGLTDIGSKVKKKAKFIKGLVDSLGAQSELIQQSIDSHLTLMTEGEATARGGDGGDDEDGENSSQNKDSFDDIDSGDVPCSDKMSYREAIAWFEKIRRDKFHLMNKLDYLIGQHQTTDEQLAEALRTFKSIKDENGLAGNRGEKVYRSKELKTRVDFLENLKQVIENDIGKISSEISMFTIKTKPQLVCIEDVLHQHRESIESTLRKSLKLLSSSMTKAQVQQMMSMTGSDAEDTTEDIQSILKAVEPRAKRNPRLCKVDDNKDDLRIELTDNDFAHDITGVFNNNTTSSSGFDNLTTRSGGINTSVLMNDLDTMVLFSEKNKSDNRGRDDTSQRYPDSEKKWKETQIEAPKNIIQTNISPHVNCESTLKTLNYTNTFDSKIKQQSPVNKTIDSKPKEIDVNNAKKMDESPVSVTPHISTMNIASLSSQSANVLFDGLTSQKSPNIINNMSPRVVREAWDKITEYFSPRLNTKQSLNNSSPPNNAPTNSLQDDQYVSKHASTLYEENDGSEEQSTFNIVRPSSSEPIEADTIQKQPKTLHQCKHRKAPKPTPRKSLTMSSATDDSQSADTTTYMTTKSKLEHGHLTSNSPHLKDYISKKITEKSKHINQIDDVSRKPSIVVRELPYTHTSDILSKKIELPKESTESSAEKSQVTEKSFYNDATELQDTFGSIIYPSNLNQQSQKNKEHFNRTTNEHADKKYTVLGIEDDLECIREKTKHPSAFKQKITTHTRNNFYPDIKQRLQINNNKIESSMTDNTFYDQTGSHERNNISDINSLFDVDNKLKGTKQDLSPVTQRVNTIILRPDQTIPMDSKQNKTENVTGIKHTHNGNNKPDLKRILYTHDSKTNLPPFKSHCFQSHEVPRQNNKDDIESIIKQYVGSYVPTKAGTFCNRVPYYPVQNFNNYNNNPVPVSGEDNANAAHEFTYVDCEKIPETNTTNKQNARSDTESESSNNDSRYYYRKYCGGNLNNSEIGPSRKTDKLKYEKKGQECRTSQLTYNQNTAPVFVVPRVLITNAELQHGTVVTVKKSLDVSVHQRHTKLIVPNTSSTSQNVGGTDSTNMPIGGTSDLTYDLHDINKDTTQLLNSAGNIRLESKLCQGRCLRGGSNIEPSPARRLQDCLYPHRQPKVCAVKPHDPSNDDVSCEGFICSVERTSQTVGATKGDKKRDQDREETSRYVHNTSEEHTVCFQRCANLSSNQTHDHEPCSNETDESLSHQSVDTEAFRNTDYNGCNQANTHYQQLLTFEPDDQSQPKCNKHHKPRTQNLQYGRIFFKGIHDNGINRRDALLLGENSHIDNEDGENSVTISTCSSTPQQSLASLEDVSSNHELCFAADVPVPMWQTALLASAAAEPETVHDKKVKVEQRHHPCQEDMVKTDHSSRRNHEVVVNVHTEPHWSHDDKVYAEPPSHRDQNEKAEGELPSHGGHVDNVKVELPKKVRFKEYVRCKNV